MIFVSQVMPGSVDIPSADGSMAIKYLDAQFSAALDFNATDNFDGTATGADQTSVSAALSNKYSQSVAANAPQHGDLPSINSFQASQQPKPNLPSSNITSVLNQTSEVSSVSSEKREDFARDFGLICFAICSCRRMLRYRTTTAYIRRRR